jgi:hypothetical protein
MPPETGLALRQTDEMSFVSDRRAGRAFWFPFQRNALPGSGCTASRLNSLVPILASSPQTWGNAANAIGALFHEG